MSTVVHQITLIAEVRQAERQDRILLSLARNRYFCQVIDPGCPGDHVPLLVKHHIRTARLVCGGAWAILLKRYLCLVDKNPLRRPQNSSFVLFSHARGVDWHRRHRLQGSHELVSGVLIICIN
jgi:hypothetical protein